MDSDEDMSGIPLEFLQTTKSDYPEPTKLKISTMTVCGTLFSNRRPLLLRLQKIYEQLPLTKQIISIEYGANEIRGFKKRKKLKPRRGKQTGPKKSKSVKRKTFYNQVTLLIQVNPEKLINFKLFLNGGFQMTGIKQTEQIEQCLTILCTTMGCLVKDPTIIREEYPEAISYKLLSNCTQTTATTSDSKRILSTIFGYLQQINLHWGNLKTVLINSDFRSGFMIERNVLNRLLLDDYGILSSFDPCKYPAVNSKYYWNRYYHETKTTHSSEPSQSLDNTRGTVEEYKEGCCYCTKKDKCSGKGRGNGPGDCKRITMAVFRSGSVIITGAKSEEQLSVCYRFINQLFKKHYNEIRI